MDFGQANRFSFVEKLDTARVAPMPGDLASSLNAAPNSTLPALTQSGLTYWWRGDAPAQFAQSMRFRLHLAAKRGTDITLSVVTLAGLAPLLVVLMVLIKLGSPGPVFFRQDREGLDGKLFRIYKFRSMRTDLGDATGIKQTKAGDDRVTKLGRFMRRTSLDELPQLFNVLLGHMSIVGPRPHVRGMFAGGVLYSNLVPYYDLRHAMKPGLTGWAQANGLRGETDNPLKARARIDHDIAYIQNFSWWLDLKCIVLTFRNEFITGSGV